MFLVGNEFFIYLDNSLDILLNYCALYSFTLMSILPSFSPKLLLNVLWVKTVVLDVHF